MVTMIEFARPDGSKTNGYLANAGRGRPGVVVIQEWWGLNDQICGVADRFARAGYNALAPDLYKGRLTAEPDEANHLMTGLDFADATQTGIVIDGGFAAGAETDDFIERILPQRHRGRGLIATVAADTIK